MLFITSHSSLCPPTDIKGWNLRGHVASIDQLNHVGSKYLNEAGDAVVLTKDFLHWRNKI